MIGHAGDYLSMTDKIDKSVTIITTRFPNDLLKVLRLQATIDDRTLSSLIVHYARQGLIANGALTVKREGLFTDD